MKAVAITGASSGIGMATAIELAKEGYEVHGTYNTSYENSLKLTYEHGIIFHKVDLSLREETIELAEKLKGLGIRALVNNAAFWHQDRVDETDLSVWDRIMEVNLTAPMILATELAKGMKVGDSIVNIASTDGLTGAYDLHAYSASKAGLMSITRGLANTLGSRGIRVNTVSPGWVDTTNQTSGEEPERPSPTIPLNRCASIQEIAGVISFLISDKASYINGANIIVDGGLINTDDVLRREAGY
ncbi:MAG TPA: SDR family oxidoreductase [Candidatus Saccharibacteria bacterium]|nr:SDR family oxidoreductase [Candidatus Saccharibacteria bacterium]HMT55741.1 SDR family oxidoreductase [Candidatus Saccharibacteria bacterium]